MHIRQLSLIAVCLLALSAAGCGSSKTSWLLTMRKTLPLTVCSAGYFDKCFAWTGAECRSAAAPHVERCSTELEPQLPATLNPISGSKWGEKLGSCVGEGLAVDNMLRMKLDDECRAFIVEEHDAATFDQIVLEYEQAKADAAE